MNREMMENISAAYTVYTLLNPADRVVISIGSFAEAYKANFAALEALSPDSNRTGATGAQNVQITEEKAEATLEKGLADAERTLEDTEKLSGMLAKVKQKMKSLPMVGSVLMNVPTMFKLLNSYLKGEYTETPRKQLIIIVSALSYLVSPIDLVPDFIPVVGLMDDMAVVAACIKATQGELERFLKWREENGLLTQMDADE